MIAALCDMQAASGASGPKRAPPGNSANLVSYIRYGGLSKPASNAPLTAPPIDVIITHPQARATSRACIRPHILRRVNMSKAPLRVAVTGAAGQIGYSLVFRIANGDLLGPDQPVILQMLEIEPALPALNGVVMEVMDCAFPLLAGVTTSADATGAVDGVNDERLVGSRPRTKGMERKDLLEANGAIFTTQGRALAKGAADDVRILVVGNPANTNCLIAMNNAGAIPRERFTAMTRLDHNRALAQLAGKVDVPVTSLRHMTTWG